MKKFWQTFKDNRMQFFDDRKYWTEEQKGQEFYPGHCWFSDIAQDPDGWRERNKKGLGLFIQVNPSNLDCEDRTEEDVASIEWVYADIDGKPKEWQMARIKEAKVKPDIIVESKNSYHIYWKCKSTREQFDMMINGLRKFFEADIAISSINEVLRIPGFLHNKDYGNPFLIRVEHIDIVGTTPEKMIEAFPAPLVEVTEKAVKQKKLKKDFFKGDDIELRMVKEIPIRTVLDSLKVPYSRDGFILDSEGKNSSAHIDDGGNYVNRFSGRDGSGSTIDVAMAWGNMNLKDSIDYLKKLGNIDSRVIVQRVIEESKKSKIMERYSKPVPRNLKTWGVLSLDKKFKKPKNGEYVLFLGEAGKGKTTYCLHMAIENAKAGNKVLFLSLEMVKERVQDRYVDLWAGISDEDRERAEYTPEQKKKMEEAIRELEHENLVMLDMKDIKNHHDFTELAKFMEGFDVIFIDNFSRITLRAGTKSEVEMQSLTSEMIGAYVDLTDSTIIMLHHYAKGTGKERGLEARGSQKIIDDCTIHASIGIDDVDPTDVKFKIIKSRYNPSGQMTIKFDRGKYREVGWKDPFANFNSVFNS